MATDADRFQALQRENERLRRAIGELSMLNELAADIGVFRDSEQVIQKIIRRSIQAVHGEQGVVTLIDEDASDPMKTLARTMTHSGEYQALRPDQSLLGWMQAHRKPLLLNRPNEDHLFRNLEWNASMHSLLCVPLLARSSLIGILTIYNKKGGRGFTHEDERLLAIIAAQSAQVIENARLLEEEKRYLQIRQELQIALDIQSNLLPKQAPRIVGYHVAGRSIPAQTVGGDYYDYIPVRENRWAFPVGDVSGKGLPAALVMANLQATLRTQMYWTASVKQCLEGANDLLFRSTNKRTFITLFCGLLDPVSHRFCYANAGHNRPLLLRANGTPVRLESGDLPLGARLGVSYTEANCTLHPGDALLLYSDGISEAANGLREQFGEERLSEILQRYGKGSASALVDRVLAAVAGHAKGDLRADDMTVLVLKREG